MASTGEKRTLRVRIEGHVQGVGYRAWAVSRARQLGLVGWVRNRSDGSVEAVLQGSADVVERMLADCRTGPPSARVKAVDILDEADGTFTTFVERASL